MAISVIYLFLSNDIWSELFLFGYIRSYLIIHFGKRNVKKISGKVQPILEGEGWVQRPFGLCQKKIILFDICIRGDYLYQIWWIFGKLPNGLCPPHPIFGKKCCAFVREIGARSAFPLPKKRNIIFWIGNDPPPIRKFSENSSNLVQVVTPYCQCKLFRELGLSLVHTVAGRNTRAFCAGQPSCLVPLTRF